MLAAGSIFLRGDRLSSQRRQGRLRVRLGLDAEGGIDFEKWVTVGCLGRLAILERHVRDDVGDLESELA